MSRTIGKEISPSRSASCGHGPTEIIWCTAGVSAMRTPAMSPIFGLQTPQAITTYDASMTPWSVCTRRMRPSSTSRSVTSTLGTTVSTPLDRAFSRMIVPARSESTTPTDGVQKAPMIWSGSRNGHLLDHEGRIHQLGLDAPRLGAGHPAAQLLHPLLGAGDLEAAGLGEDAHLLVLAHGVERQVGDLAGVVHGEDEVGGVPGRPAGVGQRPLVDLHDVGPAELGEVVDQAVADDAGSDDDDVGGGGDGGHEDSLRWLSDVAYRAT